MVLMENDDDHYLDGIGMPISIETQDSIMIEILLWNEINMLIKESRGRLKYSSSLIAKVWMVIYNDIHK